MGYVRTPAQIARIQELARAGAFVTEGISIEFETTPDFARSVLPPCFEPHEARGTASVFRSESALYGEFVETTVMIYARWGARSGSYLLTQLVSGDMPVTIGRELYGAPKKRGHSHYCRDRDDVYAYGERNGVRLVQIEATLSVDRGPQEICGYHYEIEAPLGWDASLVGDPCVRMDRVTRRFDTCVEGIGDLVLTGGDFDPVGDIPIVSTGRVVYFAGEVVVRQAERQQLPGGDAYLPYVLGRGWDDPTRRRVPARHRGRRQVTSTPG